MFLGSVNLKKINTTKGMPRSTSFSDSWLQRSDANGHKIGDWCLASTQDKEHAYCKLCKKTFSVANAGVQQILQHSKTAGHKDVVRVALSSSQPKLFEGASTSKIWKMTDEDKTDRAEVLWILAAVKCNYSFQSADTVISILKIMFPDSAIAASLSLGQKKFAYSITYGLAPFFTECLEKLVKHTHYTLGFDEATTDVGNKQLDVHIRFWNPKTNLVESRFLDSYQLGHATADIMKNKIIDCSNSYHYQMMAQM